MVDQEHETISVRRQCELIGLSRSSWYGKPAGESAENLKLMRLIDEQYLRRPFFGSRKMTLWLRKQGEVVNRKRVQRLMRTMGIEAIYARPRTTRRCSAHRIYPYLLRNLVIDRPNQVWASDITYVPLGYGFMYLVAVMDWYSRYVVSWRLSNTLDSGFCQEALDEALEQERPEIFNSDQGVQYTSESFTSRLEEFGIAISMDGKGRVTDNIFVERLWRTVKYEDIYLKGYETVAELYAGLESYFDFYHQERFHQALGYRTPGEVYRSWKINKKSRATRKRKKRVSNLSG